MLNQTISKMRLPQGQRGLSLVELMVAMVISIIVTGAIIALMSNSLGSSTTTIQTSRLNEDMRDVMFLMTRDVRRAGSNQLNMIQAAAGTLPVSTTADVTITNNNCMVFQADRDGNGTFENAGFRRVTTGGVGVVQMWTDPANTATCGGNSWVNVTDPDNIDVTALTINSENLEALILDDGTNKSVLCLQNIDISMTAELRRTEDSQGNNAVVRQMNDSVKVRNGGFQAGVPTANNPCNV